MKWVTPHLLRNGFPAHIKPLLVAIQLGFYLSFLFSIGMALKNMLQSNQTPAFEEVAVFTHPRLVLKYCEINTLKETNTYASKCCVLLQVMN